MNILEFQKTYISKWSMQNRQIDLQNVISTEILYTEKRVKERKISFQMADDSFQIADGRF